MGRIVVEKVSGWQRVGWSPGWGQRHRVACLATQFNFIGDTAAEQSEQTKTNFERTWSPKAKLSKERGGAARRREGPNTGLLFAWPRFSSSSITQKALARKRFQAFSFPLPMPARSVLYLSFHSRHSFNKLSDCRHVFFSSSVLSPFRQSGV